MARRYGMPEALQQPITVGARAELRRRQPAARDQYIIRAHAPPIRAFDRKSILSAIDARGGAFGLHIAAMLRKIQPQPVQHARRLIADGIYAPFRIRRAEHAQRFKKIDGRRGRQRGKRGAHIARIAVVIPRRCV